MLGFRKNGFKQVGVMAIARPHLREFFGMRVKEAQHLSTAVAWDAPPDLRPSLATLPPPLFQAFLSLKPDGVTSPAPATAVCE